MASISCRSALKPREPAAKQHCMPVSYSWAEIGPQVWLPSLLSAPRAVGGAPLGVRRIGQCAPEGGVPSGAAGGVQWALTLFLFCDEVVLFGIWFFQTLSCKVKKSFLGCGK